MLTNPLFEDGETVLLLERSPQLTERFEYKVTTAPIEYKWDKNARRYHAENYREFEQQLQRAVESGFRLAGLLGKADPERLGRSCDLGAILVWERPLLTRDRQPDSAGWEGTDYRLVEGFLGAELSEKVSEAAADGYRMTAVSTLFNLPGWNHLALVMERADDPSTVPEYLVLSALDLEGLGNQMTAAGAHGYRARDWAFFGNPLVAIVERAPSELGAYQYELLETNRLVTLQRELLEAGATGRVAGVTSSRRSSYDVTSDTGGAGSAASGACSDPGQISRSAWAASPISASSSTAEVIGPRLRPRSRRRPPVSCGRSASRSARSRRIWKRSSTGLPGTAIDSCFWERPRMAKRSI